MNYQFEDFLIEEVIVTFVPLLILLCLTVFLYLRKRSAHGQLSNMYWEIKKDLKDLNIKHDEISEKYTKFYQKYNNIIDIDVELEHLKQESEAEKMKIKDLSESFRKKSKDLTTQYDEKRGVYKLLLHEIGTLEEDIEFTSYGIYRPHFDFDTSESYKTCINQAKNEQKQMIKKKGAIVCHTEWSVGESKSEGKKMTNMYMKLMLRAFNGECDASTMKVNWNNVLKMEERIIKTFEAINKLGSSHHTEIQHQYLELKLKELRLSHEYKEKKHEEKEEQKEIREQLREEAKVKKEIEKAKKEADDEEKKCQTEMEKVIQARDMAHESEKVGLNELISRLQEQLLEAQKKRERALSRAQMTKSGHVYVISNIGSFGEKMYKIGMTRRIDPMDRVKELGDASVPFRFDVHAIIYSEDAPKLEKVLHKEFDQNRVNLVNSRKEFFYVSLDEIEKTVTSHNANIEFTKISEAKEFRESESLRREFENSQEETIPDRFPATL